MRHDDQEFEQRARSALDDSVNDMDAATRSRLAAMRTRACEQPPSLLRWLSTGHWLPASALAASLIIAVVIAIRPAPAPSPEQSFVAEADITLELLLDEEAQESDSDPDFYVWLDVVLAEEDNAHES